MPLRILIVHEFGVTRKITQDYILTELSDAIAELASSPLEAVQMVDQRKYDIVLCGMEMAEMDGIEVYRHMLASNSNRDTPFIIMTSTYNEQQRERLSKRGIKYVLPIPFTALQLRSMIYEISDPRRRRIYTRYSIPSAKAMVRFQEMEIPAEVVNISMNGILCDLTFPDQSIRMTRACQVTVQFPAEYGEARASNIKVSVLRMSVEDWHEDHSPRQVRIAWKFVSMPTAAQRTLELVLEKARQDLMEAEMAASCKAK